MKKEIMLKLTPEFQREIFQKVVDKYGGSIKASKHLKIPASSIRCYKNLYFNSVPNNLIQRIINLEIINKNKLIKNTLKILDKKEIMNKSLNLGRENRKKYFIKLKKEIPSLNEIFSDNQLNISKWFDKYLYLVNSNFRKVFVKSKKNYLFIEYNNFTKTSYKNFKIKIPKKIFLDDDFLYFFGLWCGDRAGGKRFGICNQNKEVLKFTENFLKRNYQQVEKILYIGKNIKEPKIKYNKKFIIDKEINGWVLSTHSNNGIFASFFYYLFENIKEFLDLVSNKNLFFAGLFDAEGNVSLYNKSFRWACKNTKLVKLYAKHLNQMNLYGGYDGGCLISYNKNSFYNNILPYLKHGKKIKHSLFLCKGEGEIPKELKKVLIYLRKNPLSTQIEIAKALKKSKVYSELSLLKEFNFILSENYPLKFKLNNENKTISGV